MQLFSRDVLLNLLAYTLKQTTLISRLQKEKGKKDKGI